jgi:glycosyltransferase involved in cell wall biosynthesis
MKKINKSIEQLKIGVIPTDRNGCGMYRVVIPYTHLQRKLPNIEIIDFSQTLNVNKLLEFDVILFQRMIDEKIYEVMRLLQKVGKICIHEIDDQLFNIKQHNPSYQTYKPNSPYIKTFIKAMKDCDYIHTTTEYLKKQYMDRLKLPESKFRSFNNSVDLSHPNYQKNLRNTLSNDPNSIVFGFQGGVGHHIDLLEIISPVKAILEKYPNTTFAFCSTPQLFQSFNIDVRRAIVIPPVNGNFYGFIPIPSYFDIGLAPLNEKDEFNYGKSYLKIVEFGAFGVPTICSNVGDFTEYGKVNPDGVMLVKNRHDKWFKAIEELILNKEKRLAIGESAYDDLVNGVTSLEYINQKRYDFFKSLCNN